MSALDDILADARTQLPESHVATLAREVERLREERKSEARWVLATCALLLVAIIMRIIDILGN